MSSPLEPVEKVLERKWKKYFPERTIGHFNGQSLSGVMDAPELNIGYTSARRYLDDLQGYHVKSLVHDVDTKAVLADNRRWMQMYRRRNVISITGSTTVSSISQPCQSVTSKPAVQTYQQADQTLYNNVFQKYDGMSEDATGDLLTPLKCNPEINSSYMAVREHLDSFQGKQLKSLSDRVDAKTVLEDGRRWLQNYSRRCCSNSNRTSYSSVSQTTQATVTMATHVHQTFGQNVLNKYGNTFNTFCSSNPNVDIDKPGSKDGSLPSQVSSEESLEIRSTVREVTSDYSNSVVTTSDKDTARKVNNMLEQYRYVQAPSSNTSKSCTTIYSKRSSDVGNSRNLGVKYPYVPEGSLSMPCQLQENDTCAENSSVGVSCQGNLVSDQNGCQLTATNVVSHNSNMTSETTVTSQSQTIAVNQAVFDMKDQASESVQVSQHDLMAGYLITTTAPSTCTSTTQTDISTQSKDEVRCSVSKHEDLSPTTIVIHIDKRPVSVTAGTQTAVEKTTMTSNTNIPDESITGGDPWRKYQENDDDVLGQVSSAGTQTDVDKSTMTSDTATRDKTVTWSDPLEKYQQDSTSAPIHTDEGSRNMMTQTLTDNSYTSPVVNTQGMSYQSQRDNQTNMSLNQTPTPTYQQPNMVCEIGQPRPGFAWRFYINGLPVNPIVTNNGRENQVSTHICNSVYPSACITQPPYHQQQVPATCPHHSYDRQIAKCEASTQTIKGIRVVSPYSSNNRTYSRDRVSNSRKCMKHYYNGDCYYRNDNIRSDYDDDAVWSDTETEESEESSGQSQSDSDSGDDIEYSPCRCDICVSSNNVRYTVDRDKCREGTQKPLRCDLCASQIEKRDLKQTGLIDSSTYSITDTYSDTSMEHKLTPRITGIVEYQGRYNGHADNVLDAGSEEDLEYSDVDAAIDQFHHNQSSSKDITSYYDVIDREPVDESQIIYQEATCELTAGPVTEEPEITKQQDDIDTLNKACHVLETVLKETDQYQTCQDTDVKTVEYHEYPENKTYSRDDQNCIEDDVDAKSCAAKETDSEEHKEQPNSEGLAFSQQNEGTDNFNMNRAVTQESANSLSPDGNDIIKNDDITSQFCKIAKDDSIEENPDPNSPRHECVSLKVKSQEQDVQKIYTGNVTPQCTDQEFEKAEGDSSAKADAVEEVLSEVNEENPIPPQEDETTVVMEFNSTPLSFSSLEPTISTDGFDETPDREIGTSFEYMSLCGNDDSDEDYKSGTGLDASVESGYFDATHISDTATDLNEKQLEMTTATSVDVSDDKQQQTSIMDEKYENQNKDHTDNDDSIEIITRGETEPESSKLGYSNQNSTEIEALQKLIASEEEDKDIRKKELLAKCTNRNSESEVPIPDLVRKNGPIKLAGAETSIFSQSNKENQTQNETQSTAETKEARNAKFLADLFGKENVIEKRSEKSPSVTDTENCTRRISSRQKPTTIDAEELKKKSEKIASFWGERDCFEATFSDFNASTRCSYNHKGNQNLNLSEPSTDEKEARNAKFMADLFGKKNVISKMSPTPKIEREHMSIGSAAFTEYSGEERDHLFNQSNKCNQIERKTGTNDDEKQAKNAKFLGDLFGIEHVIEKTSEPLTYNDVTQPARKILAGRRSNTVNKKEQESEKIFSFWGEGDLIRQQSKTKIRSKQDATNENDNMIRLQEITSKSNATSDCFFQKTDLELSFNANQFQKTSEPNDEGNQVRNEKFLADLFGNKHEVVNKSEPLTFNDVTQPARQILAGRRRNTVNEKDQQSEKRSSLWGEGDLFKDLSKSNIRPKHDTATVRENMTITQEIVSKSNTTQNCCVQERGRDLNKKAIEVLKANKEDLGILNQPIDPIQKPVSNELTTLSPEVFAWSETSSHFTPNSPGNKLSYEPKIPSKDAVTQLTMEKTSPVKPVKVQPINLPEASKQNSAASASVEKIVDLSIVKPQQMKSTELTEVKQTSLQDIVFADQKPSSFEALAEGNDRLRQCDTVKEKQKEKAKSIQTKSLANKAMYRPTRPDHTYRKILKPTKLIPPKKPESEIAKQDVPNHIVMTKKMSTPQSERIKYINVSESVKQNGDDQMGMEIKEEAPKAQLEQKRTQEILRADEKSVSAETLKERLKKCKTAEEKHKVMANIEYIGDKKVYQWVKEQMAKDKSQDLKLTEARSTDTVSKSESEQDAEGVDKRVKDCEIAKENKTEKSKVQQKPKGNKNKFWPWRKKDDPKTKPAIKTNASLASPDFTKSTASKEMEPSKAKEVSYTGSKRFWRFVEKDEPETASQTEPISPSPKIPETDSSPASPDYKLSHAAPDMEISVQQPPTNKAFSTFQKLFVETKEPLPQLQIDTKQGCHYTDLFIRDEPPKDTQIPVPSFTDEEPEEDVVLTVEVVPTINPVKKIPFLKKTSFKLRQTFRKGKGFQ